MSSWDKGPNKKTPTEVSFSVAGFKKEVLSFWESKLLKLWFIRGIMTAFPLLILLTKFTSISKFDYLRGFHALIFGWNKIISHIGSLIGKLPYVPDISPNVINGLILFSVSYQPLKISLKTLEMKLKWTEQFYVLICYVFLSFLADNGVSAVSYWHPITWVLILAIGCLIIAFIYGLKHMPQYRRGILFTFGLCIALEAFYLLNLPVLSEGVRDFSDYILGPLEND